MAKPKKHSMKPKKKVVYYLLKDSQIKQMCREVGLDTKGDKKTITARHQRYVALWNSQCELVSILYIHLKEIVTYLLNLLVK